MNESSNANELAVWQCTLGSVVFGWRVWCAVLSVYWRWLLCSLFPLRFFGCVFCPTSNGSHFSIFADLVDCIHSPTCKPGSIGFGVVLLAGVDWRFCLGGLCFGSL